MAEIGNNLRQKWRIIARGLNQLDSPDRELWVERLTSDLFPYLSQPEDRKESMPLSRVFEQEGVGTGWTDIRFQRENSDPEHPQKSWQVLYEFAIAVDRCHGSGMIPRSIWDAVADSGNLPPLVLPWNDATVIPDALARGEIEFAAVPGETRMVDPPPLANPTEILGQDTQLVAKSPDYAAPIPENACAIHAVLKLRDLCLVGADVPAVLGGATPVSLAQRIVPEIKAEGNGYGGGDLPFGLLPLVLRGSRLSESELAGEEQGFFLPGSGVPDNYFHGVIDSLPALRHYLNLGLDCPIVTPELGKGSRELLALVADAYGIPRSRIWSPQKAAGHLFREAIMPPRHDFGLNLPDFYRPLLDRLIKENHLRRTPSRIYITRGGRGSRALLNEAVVESVVARHGFTVIDMRDLSIEEEIIHIAQAGIVAGPFGAGLASLVFATPGTRVIELLNHKHFAALGMPYKRISDCCGLKHFVVVPDRLFDSISPTPSDLTMPARRLESVLHRIAPPADWRSYLRLAKHRLARLRRKWWLSKEFNEQA